MRKVIGAKRAIRSERVLRPGGVFAMLVGQVRVLAPAAVVWAQPGRRQAWSEPELGELGQPPQ